MKRLLDTTVLRFVMVGILNTLVGNVSIFLLYNVAGWSYWMSTAPMYVLVSLMSFFLNKYFTFRSRSWSWNEFCRFFINIAACYLIAYTTVPLLLRPMLSGCSVTVRENISIFIAMCFFTVLNYLGQRFFTFMKKDQDLETGNS